MTTHTESPASPDAPRITKSLMAYRRPFIVAVHLGVVALSSYAAIWLRFDGQIPAENWQPWLAALPWVILLRLVAFWWFRLYQGLWRYTGIWDLRNILSAVLISSAAQYFFVHGILGLTGYPRSVLIIDSGILILAMGGLRMGRRMMTELRHSPGQRRVVIYGAGDAGELVVREMLTKAGQVYRPVAFIDDDRRKVGWRIHGVPVLGTRDDLGEIFRTVRPDELLIAIPRAQPAAIRQLVRSLEPFKIPIKTLPNLRDLIDGKIEIAKIRDLAVEDLLTRAPIGLNPAPVQALIAGRRVMVTGAGGSIGSELCRQIAGLSPAILLMVDRYENTLHNVRLELDDLRQGRDAIAIIADVTDEARVDAILSQYLPEIVFHAAAHKHVPLMEENPCEAIKNNVRGTRLLAQAADVHGVDRFIMISTDKAVNPTSVMGASKRVAELVIQAQASGSGTSFSTVRFGNVLASNGSVVPRLLDQIRKGGPLTVTHPEMQRFFMLIPEAVQLVLHAAAQAENSATYVLDMGQQVRLVDMARHLVRLSGLIPDEDIKIVFTGLRPGEKLYEELVGTNEEARPSVIPEILCIRSSRPPVPELFAEVDRLEQLALSGDSKNAIERMKALIGTFDTSPGLSLDLPREDLPTSDEAPAVHEQEQDCPTCGKRRASRSRARTLPERLKKGLTSKRLFRCSQCGWRGWLELLDSPSAGLMEVPSPDWQSLDRQSSVIKGSQTSRFSPRDLH